MRRERRKKSEGRRETRGWTLRKAVDGADPSCACRKGRMDGSHWEDGSGWDSWKPYWSLRLQLQRSPGAAAKIGPGLALRNFSSCPPSLTPQTQSLRLQSSVLSSDSSPLRSSPLRSSPLSPPLLFLLHLVLLQGSPALSLSLSCGLPLLLSLCRCVSFSFSPLSRCDVVFLVLDWW